MSESVYYTNKNIVSGTFSFTQGIQAATVAAQGALQYGATSAMQGGSAALAQTLQAGSVASQGTLQYGATSAMQGGSAVLAQTLQAGQTQVATLAAQTTLQYGTASPLQGGSATFAQQVQAGTLAAQTTLQYGTTSAMQGGSAVFAQTVQSGAHVASTLAAQTTLQYGTTSAMQGGSAVFAQTVQTAGLRAAGATQGILQLAGQSSTITATSGQATAQITITGQGALIQATSPAANQAQFNVQGQTITTGVGLLTVRSQQTTQSTIITGGVMQNQQTQQVSDMRLKNPVRQLQGLALSNVASLQGFLYEESDLVKTIKFGQPQPIMAGLSAQEVQVFAPEIVSSKGFTVEDYEGNEETFLTLDYSRMAPYFVEAIKELKERVEALETLTESLKTV